MKKKPLGVAWAREWNPNVQNIPYEQKFAAFIKTIDQAKASNADFIVIVEPWVIGDTHDEIIESLSRLAAANMPLRIVRRRINPYAN
jgi:hypothetical protein